MKKAMFMTVAVLCCAAILPLTAQQKKASVPQVKIENPQFANPVKQKFEGKDIVFPKSWGLAGINGDCYSFKKTAAGNEVYTKCVLCGGISVPKNLPDGYNYKLTFHAKGKDIGLRTWSWEGYNPRTNHRRLNLTKQNLTADYKDYSFEFACLPKEDYVVLWIDGDKTIDKITCTLVPAKAAAKAAAKPAAKAK